MLTATHRQFISNFFVVFFLTFSANVFAQTKPKTATAPVKTATPVKPKTAVKSAQQPVKMDKIYKLDGVSVIRGKVLKVTGDSVSYSTAAAPKIRKVIAASALSKIVYANGTVKLIEAPEPVEEVKEEAVAEVVEEEKVAEIKEVVSVTDEIVLKTGETIRGRITSQQKYKVGYKSLENPDSAPEQFVPISKIWKLRYGANGQEVVLNAVKEKQGKTASAKKEKPGKAGNENVVVEKREKVVAERPVKEERTANVGSSERLYRPFKVDITTGYSKLVDDDAEIVFGFNFSIEPKYNITDHISAGLKIEAGAFIFGDTDEGVSGVIMLRSYSLTGEYLVGTKKVRPYFGIGIGLYQPVLYSTVDDESYTTNLDSQIGFAPRAGIHLGHFRLGAEFNFVKDGKLDINYSYLSIKAGATIGGGRKRR